MKGEANPEALGDPHEQRRRDGGIEAGIDLPRALGLLDRPGADRQQRGVVPPDDVADPLIPHRLREDLAGEAAALGIGAGGHRLACDFQHRRHEVRAPFHRRDAVRHFLAMMLADRLDDRFLAVVIAIEVAGTHARFGADLGNAGLVEARALEADERRLANLALSRLEPLLIDLAHDGIATPRGVLADLDMNVIGYYESECSFL